MVLLEYEEPSDYFSVTIDVLGVVTLTYLSELGSFQIYERTFGGVDLSGVILFDDLNR